MAVIIPIETKYNPKGVKTAIRDLDDFKDAVNKAGGGFQGLATITGKVMQSVGANLKDTGASLTRNVTLPVVGLGVAAGAAFIEVDNGLDAVAIGTGATGKALKDLEGSFKNVATQVTQDMGTVGTTIASVNTRLGLTGKPLEDVSKRILDIARVTGVDAAEATRAVTRAMNDQGIEAKDAAGFLDLLLKTSQLTGIGVDTLADKMAKFGSPLRQVGIDAVTTAALIGEFEKAGVNTDLVMGSLRISLGKMAKAGEKDLPAALAKGIDAIKQAKTDGEGAALALELFGAKAGPDMAAAIREGRLEVGDLVKQLKDSQGALDSTTSAVEGPEEAFARMKNELMLVGAAFGEIVVPILQDTVIPIIKRVVEAFQSLSPEQKRLIVIFAAVAAAVGPLLIVLGSLIGVLGTVVAAVGAISLPVVAVIAGIGLLVAAVVLLWTKSEAFRDAVIGVWNAIKDAVMRVVDAVKAKLDENRDAIEAVKNAFARVWEFLSTVLIPLLVRFYGTYLQAVIKVLGFVVGAIIDVISGFVRFVIKIGEVIGAIVGFVGDVKDQFDKIVEFAASLPGRVTSALSGLWDGLTSGIKGAINGVISAWNALDFGIHVTVPDWVPVFGGRGFHVDDLFPDIPYLAEGGIVRRPTLAMIGEAGPEAIIPLPRAGSSMSSQVTIETGAVQVTVNGGDSSQVQAAVDRAFDQLVRELRSL